MTRRVGASVPHEAWLSETLVMSSSAAVAISGTTDRPGGGTYHITWSLATGRTAKESNDVISRQGWERFERPIAATLVPARFR